MCSISSSAAFPPSSVRANWAQIYRQKGNPGKNFKAAALLANAVYVNTFQSTFPFIVIGLDRIRGDVDLQKNICLITGHIPKKKSEKYVPNGAVLGEPQWSTLINDAFMIGAVNSGKEVHTTHSRIPLNHIWDAKEATWSSFGRELAILKLANYSILESRAFNQVILRPPCDEVPVVLTYEQVSSELDKIRSENEAIDFILGNKNRASESMSVSDFKQ